MSEQKPKCPKCGFTNLAVERRPNGDAKCSYCKWMGAYIECFKTMNEEKPREFWLCDNTDNSGWSVDTEYSHKNHFGSVNVFHVIEKSAYDALAERLRECEAALEFYADRRNWTEVYEYDNEGNELIYSALRVGRVEDFGGERAREYFKKWGEK